MRKLRITATMKRQLADLRDPKGNARKGGVIHLPRILSCEDWEATASVQQDALIAGSYEYREKPEPVAIHSRLLTR